MFLKQDKNIRSFFRDTVVILPQPEYTIQETMPMEEDEYALFRSQNRPLFSGMEGYAPAQATDRQGPAAGGQDGVGPALC